MSRDANAAETAVVTNRHSTDLGAALTGLAVGAIAILAIVLGIVRLTNASFAAHKEGAAAEHAPAGTHGPAGAEQPAGTTPPAATSPPPGPTPH